MVLQKNTIQILKQKKFRTSRNVVKPTKGKINVLKNEIKQYFDKSGYLSWSSKKQMYIILGTNSPQNGLVDCPECRLGKLMVIRSNKTKKRFLGCSNYYNGCTASSPLLQKAKLRATKIPCKICSWPIVIFRYSRKQKWNRQCSNIKCESRVPKS
ncbi:MAG: topoisomerase DNA-binding C4 zinc finger domain-containing protein [Thaumarchaeota archaeon]|nr:topoisomerase DNA-binding C4 zinc finger domain-containing protein [Nitrososphaerota archaeon]